MAQLHEMCSKEFQGHSQELASSGIELKHLHENHDRRVRRDACFPGGVGICVKASVIICHVLLGNIALDIAGVPRVILTKYDKF